MLIMPPRVHIAALLRRATFSASIAIPYAAFAQRDGASLRQPDTFRVVAGPSRASYAVDEVFIDENNRLFTAVGTTPAVSGEILVHSGRPELSSIRELVVDLRQLTSDSERRDRALRERFLESRRYPYARLGTATLAGLPATISPNQPFTFRLDSDLEVHGTTRRTQWRGEATVAGDTLRGRATTHVAMTDFGIEVPRFLWLRVADSVKVEIQFVAARYASVQQPPASRDQPSTPGGRR